MPFCPWKIPYNWSRVLQTPSQVHSNRPQFALMLLFHLDLNVHAAKC